ncbi:MAG TPA: TolC family protein [Nitrospiraceae bacterium]|nr:TolC family protein [Nitrospiraceae bacterium]
MKAWYSMVVLSLALMGLNGCTPTRVSDRVPPLIVPERWHNAPESQPVSTSKDLSEWWKGFGDPMLNDLIDQALAANHDLRLAKARVREAQSMVTIAESALYPSLDLFLFGGREKSLQRVFPVPGEQGVKLSVPTADVVSGGLAARWELDVFGSRHLEAEAAVAQSAGTEETQRAVQVGLLAQVATNYLELRGIQQRTHILLENIEVQRERLRAVQAFYKAGLVNDMDVARQETLLHTTVGTLPVLTSTAKSLIHRLGVMIGEAPASLEERLTHSMRLPVTLPSIPRLLPSRLLEQRPDLRLAQTEVIAAAAGLGAARADLFPKFVLSASGGVGALAVGGFPSLAESVYTLGSGLTAPIFNAGRIKAQITAADARLDHVAANYEKTFLLALEDTENAYVAHTAALERRDQLVRAETAAERSHAHAQAFYQRGAVDFLSVLDAQRTRLSTSDERTKAETAVRVALVSLYRAFGGGWSGEPSVGRPPS